MKAIRRFLSPSDAAPAAGVPPRRSASMSFRPSSLRRTKRPVSQVSEASFGSGVSGLSGLSVPSAYSTVSSSRSPSARPRRRRCIDAEEHPRIISLIFQHASRSTLLKLRRASTSFRDMADAQLARHLILTSPIGTSSVRVSAPMQGTLPSSSTAPRLEPSEPSEIGIPGLSARVLWSKNERRRLTRILTGTQVVDLVGPGRARDREIADLTLQCGCARSVRLRPDASGLPPTSCPLPPRATSVIAFTSLAANAAGLAATAAHDRRASWLGPDRDRERAHLQPSSAAFIGPIPNRTQCLTVTVRYPRTMPELASTARLVPLRPLAPWEHPPSLRQVTVIFLPEEPRRKPRPRSFLGVSPTSSSTPPMSAPIYEQHAAKVTNTTSSTLKRMSWRLSTGSAPSAMSDPSPTSPTFPVRFTGKEPHLGYLTPVIRSLAANLPHVVYTLIDAGRLDPVVLGLAPGTLLSPRQVEREITRVLRRELMTIGWNSDEMDGILRNLRYVSKAEYIARVGEGRWSLETVE